jgi:hypothetical protein
VPQPRSDDTDAAGAVIGFVAHAWRLWQALVKRFL